MLQIVVISRNGAEAQDLTEDQLSLSDAEMSLVKYANDNFDDVIVMLNTANAIEMGWSDSRFSRILKAACGLDIQGRKVSLLSQKH